MKIRLLILFYLSVASNMLMAQIPGSFYIDTLMRWSQPYFSNDNIYFASFDGFLIESDYAGNILWAKQMSTPVSNMTDGDGFLYAIAGTKVLKVDSTGNFIWVKDFSGKINSASPDSNIIGDIIYDGTQLYLSIIQAPAIQQAGPHVYPSVIVLDTSGNVLHVISDHIQPGTSFGLKPGIASLHGGAWLGYTYAPGFTHSSYLKRVTSSGNYDLNVQSPAFFFSTTTDIRKCIALPDSTYLVATNSNSMSGGNFGLSNVLENGNVIWQKVYYDTLLLCGTSGTQIAGITSDSSGNIYVTGTAGENPCVGSVYFGVFCMKLDSMGNVLFTKLWKQSVVSLINGVNCLQYKLGKLYCSILYEPAGFFGKPGMLIMDTAFSSSCDNPDTLITVHGSDRGININPVIFSPPVFVYNALSDTITNFSIGHPLHPDLCLTLNYPEVKMENNFRLFPNPTSGKLKIKNEKLIIESIEVLNLIGEKILELNAANEIDLSNQSPGIYFIRIKSEGKIFSDKIVKQ